MHISRNEIALQTLQNIYERIAEIDLLMYIKLSILFKFHQQMKVRYHIKS